MARNRGEVDMTAIDLFFYVIAICAGLAVSAATVILVFFGLLAIYGGDHK